jgi:hypothetical protein
MIMTIGGEPLPSISKTWRLPLVCSQLVHSQAQKLFQSALPFCAQALSHRFETMQPAPFAGQTHSPVLLPHISTQYLFRPSLWRTAFYF